MKHVSTGFKTVEEYTKHTVKMVGVDYLKLRRIVNEMGDVYMSSKIDPRELAEQLDCIIDSLNYTTSKLQKHYKELCDNTDYESEYM